MPVTRQSSEIRRAAVLAALKGGAGAVSGQTLAAELGISRVAVRKHVEVLRSLGYGIDARAGAGYRLASVPDAHPTAYLVPQNAANSLSNASFASLRSPRSLAMMPRL